MMTFDEWIDDNMKFLHDSTILGDLRLAFNAGRPKWHKVADGDLPPVRMVVFVSGYLGDMKDLHGFDEWDGEKWLNTDIPGLVREVWCEIPKYTKEVEE